MHASGAGKSKFLEGLKVEVILAGRADGLVDPHTDLLHDTLRHLASRGYFDDESTFQRLIYFDPTQTDFVIPFNVLRTNAPPYAIADMVIMAFRRTWPEASSRLGKMTTMRVDLTWLSKAGSQLYSPRNQGLATYNVCTHISQLT